MCSLLVLMMFALSAIVTGAPSLRRASDSKLAVGSWCDGLGDGLLDTAQNFTLAAFNTTQANANDTGLPIVLASTGATSGASSNTFATWGSWPYNDWPNLSMDSGGLTANSATQPRTIVTAADNSSAVFFLTTNNNPGTQPAQIFCSVPSNTFSGQHTYPYLAVNNHYDLFSLCSTDIGVWQVIYNVTAGVSSYSYNVDSCFPIYLNMLGNFY